MADLTAESAAKEVCTKPMRQRTINALISCWILASGLSAVFVHILVFNITIYFLLAWILLEPCSIQNYMRRIGGAPWPVELAAESSPSPTAPYPSPPTSSIRQTDWILIQSFSHPNLEYEE